jgi:outer membrane protein assembly factor BamB
MVRGFRDGRSSDSPVWQFTTAERTNTYGLANEHGVVRNGVGFFELASGNLVMAVDPDTYELLWQYDFKDIYDVAPMVEQKKDGSWLVLEHERANSRVKALYVSDGSVAWISDNNIPYIGGTGLFILL